MLIRTLVLVTATLFFNGCATSLVEERLEDVGDEASQAADLAFKSIRRTYCDGATMGAVRRAYGDKPDQLRAYLEDCGWGTWPEK